MYIPSHPGFGKKIRRVSEKQLFHMERVKKRGKSEK
jgi:hypothetical protein